MKKFLLVISILGFSITHFSLLYAQTTNWQYDGTDYDSWAYYKPGKVVINFYDANVPIVGPLAPTLLVHGLLADPPPSEVYHIPVIRLQGGDENLRPPSLFRESRIEFWSDYYESPTEWFVGQITSFNAADQLEVLDNTSESFLGGLKFFCSNGYDADNAFNPDPKVDVMRLVAGKVGIGVFPADIELPRATLDLRRSPWGIEGAHSDNNGKVFSVGDIQNENLEIFEDGQVRIGSGACVGSGQQTFTGIKLWVDGKVKIGDDMIDDQSDYYDTYNLSVDGVIVTKELVVTQFDWSDFVFDKNYKLKSIDEVQEFITDNKHLPDIPKESKLKTSGLNVAEMQAKLLQKIEELTLYVIELNNENNELKKRIELLEE